MSNPWLTIITATKDDSVGLMRTLTSTAALRAAEAEHLVVDGGADVAAAEKAAAQAGDSILVLRRPPQGIVDAFNFGLSQARGDWVWYLNGGDAIHESLDPEWLKIFLTNTHAGVVTGAVHYDGEECPRVAPPIRMQWPLVTSWLPHPSTLIRRMLLTKIGGFDPRWKICMDFDLWYRLLSGSVTIDVVAVPFARFDLSGISQRAETRPLLLRENAAVLWQYKTVVLRTWWQKGWLWIYVFLHAAKRRWF